MCKSFLNVSVFLQRQSGHCLISQLCNRRLPFLSLLEEPSIYNRYHLSVISIFRVNQAVRICYIEGAVANFSAKEQQKMLSDFPDK